MTLTIRRDDRRSAGGYAVLCFAEASPPVAPVSVAVMETFGGRWLALSAGDAAGIIGIGDPNWQAGRHDFGPYAVTPVGTGFEVTVGPEIVNKIDGYTNLRLTAGSVSGTASWPDDIAPLAGAATVGGLQVMRKAAEVAPRRTANLTDVQAVEANDPPAPAPEGTGAIGDAVAPPKRNLALPLGLAALVLIGLALAAWFLLAPPPAAPVAIPAPVAPPVADPAPVAAADPAAGCTLEALRAAPGALTDRLALVRACGSAVGPDTLLRLIEDAAATDDPAALMLFGAIYDGAETDTLAEGAVGLTFGDVPAQAAEYYGRAASAGAPEAAARLARVCAALETATDTLSQGARDDFCS